MLLGGGQISLGFCTHYLAHAGCQLNDSSSNAARTISALHVCLQRAVFSLQLFHALLEEIFFFFRLPPRFPPRFFSVFELLSRFRACGDGVGGFQRCSCMTDILRLGWDILLPGWDILLLMWEAIDGCFCFFFSLSAVCICSACSLWGCARSLRTGVARPAADRYSTTRLRYSTTRTRNGEERCASQRKMRLTCLAASWRRKVFKLELVAGRLLVFNSSSSLCCTLHCAASVGWHYTSLESDLC